MTLLYVRLRPAMLEQHRQSLIYVNPVNSSIQATLKLLDFFCDDETIRISWHIAYKYRSTKEFHMSLWQLASYTTVHIHRQS
jgi:hypothetical protein